MYLHALCVFPGQLQELNILVCPVIVPVYFKCYRSFVRKLTDLSDDDDDDDADE